MVQQALQTVSPHASNYRSLTGDHHSISSVCFLLVSLVSNLFFIIRLWNFILTAASGRQLFIVFLNTSNYIITLKPDWYTQWPVAANFPGCPWAATPRVPRGTGRNVAVTSAVQCTTSLARTALLVTNNKKWYLNVFLGEYS